MKRRDFIKTSVGAGFAVSATTFAGRSDAVARGAVQQGQTMFDRIWEART